MSRPDQPCQWCGGRTRSLVGICKPCIIVDRRHQHEPSEHAALTGGRWVPRGLIQVWEAETPVVDSDSASVVHGNRGRFRVESGVTKVPHRRANGDGADRLVRSRS